MTTIDATIVMLYLAATVAVGWRYGRSNRSRDDFLLGGRKMSAWPVGLSLMVSWFSAISYMAVPGEIVAHGPLVLTGLAAAPVTLWLLSEYIVVRIRTRQVTSAYEWLDEWQLSWLASGLFLCVRLAWMAVIVHIVAAVLISPVGFPPFVTAAGIVGVATVYSLGGFRAVVATDVLQAAIMFAGAVLVIVCLSPQATGPTEWPVQWPAPSWNWSPMERVTVPWAIASAICMGICVRTGDQMAVQRYLSVPTVGAAKRVVWLSWVADLALTGLLVAVGLCLYTTGTGGDDLFPRFISSGLPVGVTGLVLAAIVAASASSLSSGINSCVSTVAAGFRNPFPVVATVFFGIIVFCLSQVIPLVQGNTFELCYKVVNLLQVPLGGLMLSALFMPRATRGGLIAGVVASAAVVIYVNYFSPLSFLVAAPAGLAVSIGCGIFWRK